MRPGSSDRTENGERAAATTNESGERTDRRRERKTKPSAEVKALRKRLEDVEKQIQALEARLTEIGDALADPSLYTDGERARAVTSERKRAEEQVAWLLHEWEELSTALAAHE
jgi:ATP-binding cassette subfamily F protein 3